MSIVTSKDGTAIGYTKQGSGPVVILIDGAMCHRTANSPMPKLADLLEDSFTVITYDRRGRGESSDNKDYTIQKEIEDIDALIEIAGGSASLFGISSGAILATMAASALSKKVSKLAVYEAPLVLDNSRAPIPDDYVANLQKAIAENDRSHAIQLFMKDAVGLPSMMVKVMPFFPGWSRGEKIAHTLVYDGIITQAATKNGRLVSELWTDATMPVFVSAGSKSLPWMRNSSELFAKTFKNSTLQIVPDQNHMLKPQVHAPLLKKFFDQ